MNYLILTLCCIDCKHLYEYYFCDIDYYDFITNLEDYEQYYYIVLDLNNKSVVFDGEGYDL